MSIEIRALRADDPAELDAFVSNDLRAFSSDLSREALIRRFEADHEPDRFVVADDDGEIVGNAGAISMQLTVAPGSSVPAAGVTWVGVSPTHRRRGVMRGLLGALHADARRLGEPVAVLWASESSIYHHLGYGPATVVQPRELHPRLLRWRDPDGSDRGTVRAVEPSGLAPVAEAVRLRQSLQRVGALVEPPKRWTPDAWSARWRNGPEAPGTFAVVHRAGTDEPDGYALYRVVERWDGGFPSHHLDVMEMATTTTGAHRELWRFLCSIDLVGRVTADGLAPDDPLPWLLHNPREVRTTGLNDAIWVRLLDVEAFFTARLAGVEPAVVVEVTGPADAADQASVTGRWRLGAGGASRTEAPAEAELGVAELGALSLGGHDPRVLVAAGRITELVTGGAARLAEVLAAPHAPFCDVHF